MKTKRQPLHFGPFCRRGSSEGLSYMPRKPKKEVAGAEREPGTRQSPSPISTSYHHVPDFATLPSSGTDVTFAPISAVTMS